MMLTSRVLNPEEGQAAGLSHYRVEPGEGLDLGLDLAAKAASVAPMTTYAVLRALPRIAELGPHEGYLMESLMAAVASSSQDAQARMREFLEGRAARVTAPAQEPP
jgi:enoyl-CoA hydratase/carnithine racemase